jgi:ABC-type ATPase involved in cell division
MANSFGKLRTLTVKGYQSIRAIERLELRDLHILIGPNGAGKSNFISLFPFLVRLARNEIQDVGLTLSWRTATKRSPPFRRLTEDEVKLWMDDFAMGEILEKNLIGARP